MVEKKKKVVKKPVKKSEVKVKDNILTRGKEDKCGCERSNHCGSGIYGLGFIGALIYYISTAGGFWMGVLGVLKAIVWPVFMVLELLKFIGA